MAGAPTVRSATREDLLLLKDFEQGIITAERPYDHTLKPDPISYYDIGELIDSDDAEVAVVELDGEIVASGYAHKQRSKHYIQHEWHAFLGFMFVRPEYRGRGLNKVLIEIAPRFSSALRLGLSRSRAIGHVCKETRNAPAERYTTRAARGVCVQGANSAGATIEASPPTRGGCPLLLR